LIQNSYSDNLTFYTDGSIKDHKTPNIKSGIGWICEANTNINFNASTKSYADTNRTELEAVLSLLLVIPSNFSIKIHLDNQTAIKNLQYTSFLKQLHTKNWDIISFINHLKTLKNLNIQFLKIKSHTNSFHNQADSLAKRGTSKPILELLLPTTSTYFL